MAKIASTASLTFQPSRGLVDRILGFLDHCARISARNGDVAYFGL